MAYYYPSTPWLWVVVLLLAVVVGRCILSLVTDVDVDGASRASGFPRWCQMTCGLYLKRRGGSPQPGEEGTLRGPPWMGSFLVGTLLRVNYPRNRADDEEGLVRGK
jgi:hypothetical protein